MLRTFPNKAVSRQRQDKREQNYQPQAGTLPPQQPRLQRIWKHRYLMHYHRLIALVMVVNLVLLGYGLTQWGWFAADGINLMALSNMVIVNIGLAIIIRQQYVINLLFKIATSVPTSWPLRFRQLMGKVYHFGGIHVGGAIVGTLWFGTFAGSLIYSWTNGLPGVSQATMIVTIVLLGLLLGMIGMSMPQIRAKYHDQFELVHRFGGWASLLLFWWQTVLFINDQRGAVAFGDALLAAPGFWLLLAVTVSIVLPWLRLKKVAVNIERPSSHVALVRFNHGVTPFAGSATTVSRSPLTEWHSFANVPAPGEDGFRLTISRAGDWTGQLIDEMPSHVWVKGIPTAGVGNIDKLFKKVVWIATGSGIGPTLPHLLAHTAPAHLVWSTRTPRQTYGDALVDEILEAEPTALIWDTNENGRPDLVQLAYDAVQEFDAEAVIVISNKKLTWQVVYGMESRGIPAYGAIWDS
ncbi:FIG01043304: hypothetical protein [hydrothermal vent metagenome]|uniref:Uncharacterized protein n=1 Tax=hydrothermal vent metagenome TaxID=652676 RepID=A0A3B0UMI6_9ZZZZ